MPFCPDCSMEFGADVTICPDCHTQLVAQLQARRHGAAITPDGSWVAICRIAGAADARKVRDFLDSNNIPSMTLSSAFQHGTGAQLSKADGTGDVIAVPREFGQEARILLEALLDEKLGDADALA